MRSAPYRRLIAALAASLVASAASASGPGATVVFSAPGAPGTTQEAQGAMDAFAAALAARAHLPAAGLGATYAATEESGVARLRDADAAIAIVSLPFFLKHERALGLRAELQAAVEGRGGHGGAAGTESWSLVARKGRAASPAALDGFTILSSAGFAPGFVRGPALGAFGRLPPTARIVQSVAVLSGLRRAAAGEPVAVLLDGAQAAALPSLPFASELEVVARSPALPVGVVARVGQRLPPARWARLEAALRELPEDPAGAEALRGIRMSRFVALDRERLSAARRAYAEASR